LVITAFRHPQNEYWIAATDPELPPTVVKKCTGDEDSTCAVSEELNLYAELGFLLVLLAFITRLGRINLPAAVLLISPTLGIGETFFNNHLDYFVVMGVCPNPAPPPALAQCPGDPPQYASASEYCKTLCRRVCAVTACSVPSLQQSLVDSCYENCACQTQGLSFNGICVGSSREPGLVFCYDTPGCPPSNGHYFTQGDLTSYSQIFGVPMNTCPLGQKNLINGY
jgi:hypothetical protein